MRVSGRLLAGVAATVLLAGAVGAADIQLPARPSDADSAATEEDSSFLGIQAPALTGVAQATSRLARAVRQATTGEAETPAGVPPAVAADALHGVVATAPSPRGSAEPAPGAAPAPPLARFRSERDAFRSGIRDYNSGDITSAVRALEYAATRGHAPAQWKLGRMYAEGDGVPHDDLKAFNYFMKVVQAADDGRQSARFASNAYVALGGYYLDGIPGTQVRKDETRARQMFQYAASYYGDPDAQYNLARMCLNGQGGPGDARLAARWLHLAAEKHHVPSQALLGHLLLTGQGDVPRNAARGLMWLTIARSAADPARDAWIVELYDQAIALVSDNDRRTAQLYLERRGQN